MKFGFTYILFFLGISIYCQQIIVVKYDFNSNGINYPALLEIENSVAKSTIFYSMVIEKLPKLDSLNNSDKGECKFCESSKSFVLKGEDAYFYNYPDETYSSLISMQKRFYIKEVDIMKDWILGDEQKEILGHKCQNAFITFKDRKYEVYFAKDIPLSFGPWKFKGLSGLILEAKSIDGKYSFYANSITSVNKKSVLENEIQKVIKSNQFISWSEYYTMVNNKLVEKNKKINTEDTDNLPNLFIIGETMENIFNETSAKLQKAFEEEEKKLNAKYE